MHCEAITNGLLILFVIVCLPILIYTTLVQNKFNKLIKVHNIHKSQLKNETSLPEEVRLQVYQFKKWGVILLIVVLIWMLAFGVNAKFCEIP